MTTKLYSAILEIEAHANGGKKDVDRFLFSIADIRQSTIAGCPVIAVLDKSEAVPAEVSVPHFGYNILCQNDCKHELASYGILRYFGVYLIMDCDQDILGNVYKPNSYSQLTICGVEKPFDGNRWDMPKAEPVKSMAQ